jgi:hypothetical protein
MLKLKYLIHAALLLLLCSCASPDIRTTAARESFFEPEVSYDKNDFNGGEMWLLRNNRLFNDEAGTSVSRFAFDLEKYKKGGGTICLILIDYYSDEKLFISGGESLVLMVDGERMTFSSGGGLDNWKIVDNAVVRMTAYYPATEKQLKRIGEAKKIQVKVLGYTGYHTAWFGQHNLEAASNFYSYYVYETKSAIADDVATKNGIKAGEDQ